VSRKNLLHWNGQGRLLDVGCGVGSALWRLRSYGWDVQGLELDDAAAAVGRERGLPIATGSLEDCDLVAGSFDVVRMSHVLEHACSPLATLKAAHRLLRPGGSLLMMLPNIGSFGLRRFGTNWFPLELPRHLWHFTPSTLGRLCAAAGFERVRIRCRTTADMWMRSWQYVRDERAARSGRPLVGRPLHQRRWLKRLVMLPVWIADRCGVGDLMDCTGVKA
jgi:SAM-dependent methyltransferase